MIEDPDDGIDRIHVVPLNVMVPHDIAVACWCRPLLDYTDPITKGEVWVHKAPEEVVQ